MEDTRSACFIYKVPIFHINPFRYNNTFLSVLNIKIFYGNGKNGSLLYVSLLTTISISFFSVQDLVP